MSLLILKDLKKHYGAQEVLRGATLTIDPGKKLGMVGRNGGGKTTLMAMIEGHETPDWGSVTLAKGARIGSVPQRPNFEPGVTVRQYVESGLAEAREVMAELEQAGEEMGSVEGVELERLMKQHDRLTERLEALGGWETERRAETVLSGIGLAPELWDREARTLSGGEKSRTALARELIGGHDLLLLDEPTNHLDLDGIEWIENYIKELKGAVLIVSHDRRLLENAVSEILELERGELTRYPGNYSRYIAVKEERYLSDLRAFETQQDFIRKEEGFIKKHMGSQRTAEAKGRLKKLRHVVRLECPYPDVRRPIIHPPKAVRGGELVLETRALSGGYPGNVLFKNVDLRIGRGQRIGLVGRNGTGKTTLLRILAEQREPLAGIVDIGHGAACGYFDQDTSFLRDDGTPASELLRAYPSLTDLEVRSHLARFLFRGNEVDKPIPALSGGERARLALAVLVRSEPSWLALDEPTNHLDLASRTALEEMLSEFQGAMVCVSHDREFLDGLCDHMFVLEGGGVRTHNGNYSSWHRLHLEELATATEERARKAGVTRKAANAKKEKERVNAQVPAKQGKKRVRNPYALDKLEKRIMSLEEELQELHAKIAKEDVYRDPERLKDTQIRIAELEHELARSNEEWESWA